MTVTLVTVAPAMSALRPSAASPDRDRTSRPMALAIELPHDAAVQRIADALRRLDDTIREVHDHVFASRNQEEPPPSRPPDRSG